MPKIKRIQRIITKDERHVSVLSPSDWSSVTPELKPATFRSRILTRRKQRSAFDQVSEFDRERIVAYRDRGLTFREIGSRVGRNQTTVMWICDRWMQ
ncbi:HTH_38 domain-containing protein [Trichonephila clavipes]|nr:HTH_38 domain-containing protein [Trichonephila clavipes]